MPLMYVILKDAGADIEEASKRIEEGKCDKEIQLKTKCCFSRFINNNNHNLIIKTKQTIACKLAHYYRTICCQ